jgi:hypothetical protein
VEYDLIPARPLQAFIEAFNGVEGLKDMLSSHVQDGTQAPIVRKLDVFDSVYTAVKTDEKFGSWGIVKTRGKDSPRVCVTCVQSECRHLDITASPASVPKVGRGEEWESSFRKVFDLDAGHRKLTCLSKKPIPERSTDDDSLRATLRAQTCGGTSVLGQTVEGEKHKVCKLSVEELNGKCPLCDEVGWGVPECGVLSYVFMPLDLCELKFEFAKCLTPGCIGRLDVDGYDYALLRSSPTRAFSYVVLYEWTDLCGLEAQPWWSFFRNLLLKYRDVEEVLRRKLLQNCAKAFQNACMDFIQLFNIDYRLAFTCPHGLSTVQFDGVTIGHAKKNCHVSRTCWGPEDGVASSKGSAFRDRLFVRSPHHRAALLKLAKGKSHPDRLGIECYLVLMDELSELGPSSSEHLLLPILQKCVVEGGIVTAPDEARRLLGSMGTPAPASTLLRAQVWPLVHKLVRGVPLSNAMWLSIRSASVGVAELIKGHLSTPLPDDIRCLLGGLIATAAMCSKLTPGAPSTSNAPSTSSAPRSTPVPVAPGTSSANDASRTSPATIVGAQLGKKSVPVSTGPPPPDRPPHKWTSDEAFLRTAAWSGTTSPWSPSDIGGSDIRRRLGRYDIDKSTTRRAEIGQTCTKHKEGHQRLVPGCCVGWCLQCGISVGFTVMANAESARTIFEWLLTRCDEAPKIVCYDNGCNAQQYFLNREPEFFGTTACYVDAMHHKGHDKCSEEYSSSHCESITNSSLAEQKNSILRSLESHVGYMSQTVFLLYMRFYLYRMNRLQREKTEGRCFFAARKYQGRK